MSLFSKIFKKAESRKIPNIRFGRYSDIYHTTGQDTAFDQSVQEFENGNFLDAYYSFFNYLRNEKEDNVRVWKEKGEIKFELFQGSKKVEGYGNIKKLHAEARVAKAKKMEASFMRRLLEENFELKYSRFSVTPENEIAIVFDTYTIDGSPYKLYAALKELATHADKQDDILLDEFPNLEPVESQIRRQLSEVEKEIKYKYIVREIKSVFDEIDHGKLNADKYPVGITYLFLYLCYKLDYLTKPEGHMMETLERIHRQAFAKDGKNVAQKNNALRKEFQKLLDRPKEKYFQEMYEVRATFGITGPIDHQQVGLVIEQELNNMKWYREHGHDKVALSIPGFIAGRCLFYFAVPLPDREYFHFLIQILESEYFRELGFPIFLKNGELDKKAIEREIKNIAEKHRPTFPYIKPDLKKLKYGTLPEFSESYCWMVKELDLRKVY